MFNFFTRELLNEEKGRYLDLSPIFPPNIKAFFLVDIEIENFLKKKNLNPQKICRLKQIHSNLIVKDKDGVEGDGIYTSSKDIAITIKVADCVPILISAEKGKKIIVLHSGWKGTYLQIAEKALSLFEPEDCDALWIGPSIRSCCYEVPKERCENFIKKFGKSNGILFEESRLDLPVINCEMFKSKGIPKEKIYIDGRCTCCDKEIFASFRRDKEKAKRMVLLALMTA